MSAYVYPRIIKFLRGEAFDTKIRTLAEMQRYPSWKLERSHDVLQWMFPTDIKSKSYDEAPILTLEYIQCIQADKEIQSAIRSSLNRMLAFYEENDYWVSQRNHNFKRLTRILRCLWLAGLKRDYVCLQKALDEVYVDYADIVGEETYSYWKNANNDEFMKNPLKRAIVIPPPGTKIIELPKSSVSIVPVGSTLDDEQAKMQAISMQKAEEEMSNPYAHWFC